MNKEHLALRNNFWVNKNFLIAKFDCIRQPGGSKMAVSMGAGEFVVCIKRHTLGFKNGVQVWHSNNVLIYIYNFDHHVYKKYLCSFELFLRVIKYDDKI